MTGFRIHHPVLRDCVALVPHPGDAQTGRRPKDYRITLNADGDCIVSETVWMRLQQARASGLSPHEFLLLNEVKDPPKILAGNIETRGHQPTQVRTFRQQPDGTLSDEQLLSVAQQLAPPGIRARIKAGE